jgi:hypothetical protein
MGDILVLIEHAAVTAAPPLVHCKKLEGGIY